MSGALLRHNLGDRFRDGFSLGYHLVLPICLMGLMGLLTRNIYHNIINSFQYYAITIVPYCTLLGMTTAAYAGKEDAYAKTAMRILASPLSDGAIVISKIVSCTLIFSGCSLVSYVILGSFSVTPIWDSLLPASFFFMMLSFVSSACGTLVGLSTRNFLAVKNLISILVTIAAAVGGSFYPFRSSNQAVMALIRVSPVTQINRSLCQAIYDGSSRNLYRVSFLCLVAGVVVTIAAVMTFRREEYGNGDIPGYEK